MDDTTPSPWPAPNIELGGPPQPTDHELPMPVVVDTPPKKSRKGLIAGVGVLTVAALGVGAFVLLKGDTTPAFALDRAAANAAAAHGVKSHITTAMLGQTIEMDGEANRDTGATHFSMDLGSALGFDASLEAIVDAQAGVMYLSSDFLSQFGADVGTKWVKLDKKALSAAGQDASVFDQIGAGNSMDPAALMEKAKSVKELGFDTVDGEKVQHFVVEVDVAALASIDASLQEQLDKVGAELPDSLTYDMYVTEKNELRRVKFDLQLGAGSFEVDTVQHMLAEPPVIEIPSKADVTDLADVL